jgi:serine/threonine-protein kinase
MSPERWTRIEQIVQSALDCAPAGRSAVIDTACGSDTELRREVESLLAFHEDQSFGDQSFATDSGFADGIRVLEHRTREQTEGLRIGNYRILREIGRGGMGAVYLAARADDAFNKLVALKIIRRGLDLEDVVRRFRSERQILAMLDHPNIGRLLDGGATEEGLPYFVMEYIEGEPLDRYCEKNKPGIAERLTLFQGICSAVSYAHQNLIVHRDLKPANVLITPQGLPRLLDFGIAKILAPESGQEKTITGIRPLTPEYASPEQVRGEPVTTASDIYSLGVLLYWLLTSRSPYRSPMTSPVEIERAICEEEPVKPSAAVGKREARELKGDLDTVVLMALRKEPRRRYASVEQLSEDVRRHLANIPVTARPDTRGYRASKFLRRNWAWVAMGAVTFLSLSGGIVASLWQTHVARKEQARAARVSEFLQDVVGYSRTGAGSQNQKGVQATVDDLLEYAARRVETELKDQPEVKAELLGTIGGTYANRSKIELAQRYLGEAVDLNRKLYGPGSLQGARNMYALGVLYYRKGDYAGADSWFSKALPVAREHARDGDSELVWFVSMLSDAAFGKRAVGQLGAAEALWGEALNYAPRMPQKYKGMDIELKTFLAQSALDRGDVGKADPLAYEAVQSLRAFGGDHIALAQSLLNLGNVRRLEKKFPEAEALTREGIDLYRQVQGNGHTHVAGGLLALASVHYDEARYDLAEQDAHQAQEIVAQLPPGGNVRANLDSILGRVLNKTGRPEDAEPLLREAVAIRQKSQSSPGLADPLGLLGECLLSQKRYAEAEPVLIESYRILKDTQFPKSLALEEARQRIQALYSSWGRPAQIAF